jgi:predicted nucleotidyltransferase
MHHLIETKRTELAQVCAQYRVRRLELFGSATGERFDPDTSDLDFLVEFQDLSPREHADVFFGLMEKLQQLFGRPVDLVELRAIRNPYFLQAVEQTRTLLYAAA